MEVTAKMEKDLSSAAAFVEGGIQDACDDACSICLEEFCESDPSAVTGCKHEFHLQCILEWCQRSSQCPMCWQPISLKDPISQELLEAVESERNIRQNQTRTTTIFHHPAFGGFEFHNLPVSGSDAEFEERIMQHLSAAAAMGRLHHISRREGQRGRSGPHRQPQFLVFPSHPSSGYFGYQSASSAQEGQNESNPAIFSTSPSSVLTPSADESTSQGPCRSPSHADHSEVMATENGTTGIRPNPPTSRMSDGQATPVAQDRPGPSDFQSLSESFRSRLSAVSVRYKESISKSTRGWRERFFSRSSFMVDRGSEARGELIAGTERVSHMTDHIDTRENRTSILRSSNAAVHSAAESNDDGAIGNHIESHPNNSASSACCATSSSN